MTEWITAFSGMFALIAAAWAAWTAAKVHKLERDRDNNADQEKRMAQASTVAAWSAIQLDSDGKASAYGVVVNNGSTTPIFDVELDAQDLLGTLTTLNLRLLPPGQFFVESNRDRSGWSLPEQSDALAGSVRPVTRKEEWAVMRLAFRDAQNITWSRNRTGLLERVELQGTNA